MRRLLALTDAVALIAAAALLGVVAASIAGRALFDATGGALRSLLPGAIELSGLALMVMVFAALPRAVVAGMVRVDVIAERLPEGLRGLLDRIWSLATALFGAALAWLFGKEAWLQLGRGDETQDLRLPLAIFTAFAAAAGIAVAAAALHRAFRRTGQRQ